jgi:hypothetical protein
MAAFEEDAACTLLVSCVEVLRRMSTPRLAVLQEFVLRPG